MNDFDLISVIIPVYNVEKYLRECVDSVLSQTYSNLEILLIDDGSTDSSGAICDEYATRDGRIRVIHQKNGGLSAARNAGLDAARGQYISFIDSDDFIGPLFIEVLYQTIKEENAQIAACGYCRFQDGESIGEEPLSGHRFIWSRKEAILELTKVNDHCRGEFVTISCNKLYIRSLFENLRFPVGKLHEDEYMILPLLLQIERMVKCEDVLYFYRQRSDSITGAERRYDARHLEVLDAFRERCVVLSTPEYKDIYPNVVSSYFDVMCYLACKVARPCGMLHQLYFRYFRDLMKYGKWVRGKRYFLFALSSRLYHTRYLK